jgi:hypothetical protein
MLPQGLQFFSILLKSCCKERCSWRSRRRRCERAMCPGSSGFDGGNADNRAAIMIPILHPAAFSTRNIQENNIVASAAFFVSTPHISTQTQASVSL